MYTRTLFPFPIVLCFLSCFRLSNIKHVISYVSFSPLLRRAIIAGTKFRKEIESPAWGTCLDFVHLSRLVQTAKTQDAAQNPAEFLQCTERNGDHSPSCVDPGESSSLTDTVTKTFVNPVYENNDRDESEIEDTEIVENEFVVDTKRFRSIHRYFHFEQWLPITRENTAKKNLKDTKDTPIQLRENE